MTDSITIPLVCETEDCDKITSRLVVYEYYTTDLKRILKHSNNYCPECHQKRKDEQKYKEKIAGTIKGFKLK